MVASSSPLVQEGRVRFELGDRRLAVEPRALDHLGQARDALVVREGAQRGHVAQHEVGLIEGAHQVLAAGPVEAGLAPHRAVHHGQQRGGHLAESHTAQEGGRGEAGQVADHPATDSQHQRVAVHTGLERGVPDSLHRLDVLPALAVLELNDHAATTRRREPLGHLTRPGAAIVGVVHQHHVARACLPRALFDARPNPAANLHAVGALPERHHHSRLIREGSELGDDVF
jgi:hypothetical protein